MFIKIGQLCFLRTNLWKFTKLKIVLFNCTLESINCNTTEENTFNLISISHATQNQEIFDKVLNNFVSKLG